MPRWSLSSGSPKARTSGSHDLQIVDTFTVMPGLVPGIHVLLSFLRDEDVVKPGHDE
jgi:hypothetical protein